MIEHHTSFTNPISQLFNCIIAMLVAQAASIDHSKSEGGWWERMPPEISTLEKKQTQTCAFVVDFYFEESFRMICLFCSSVRYALSQF